MLTIKKNESAGSISGSSRVVRSCSLSSMNKASKGKRRKSNSLPPETVEYLKKWMMSPEHIAHPYPTEQEKAQIMADTGIELKQLTNWFVNNRKRYWKPRVEARLIQEQAQAAAVAFNKDIDILPSPSLDSSFSMTNTISANPAVFITPPKKSRGEPTMSASTSSSSLSLLGSPGRVVSDQSESDSVGSDDEEIVHLSSSTGGQQTTEDSSSFLTQTEYINVAILRPQNGSIPTIDDVTILNNVPSDRILRVFEDCTLSYNVPSDSVSNHHKVCSHID